MSNYSSRKLSDRLTATALPTRGLPQVDAYDGANASTKLDLAAEKLAAANAAKAADAAMWKSAYDQTTLAAKDAVSRIKLGGRIFAKFSQRPNENIQISNWQNKTEEIYAAAKLADVSVVNKTAKKVYVLDPTTWPNIIDAKNEVTNYIFDQAAAASKLAAEKAAAKILADKATAEAVARAAAAKAAATAAAIAAANKPVVNTVQFPKTGTTTTSPVIVSNGVTKPTVLSNPGSDPIIEPVNTTNKDIIAKTSTQTLVIYGVIGFVALVLVYKLIMK